MSRITIERMYLISSFSGKSSGGGSANTSRASTPVSERSFKVTPATKRGPNAIGKTELLI